MFSQTFAGGAVRAVREATKDRPDPPAIYGHNAGIGGVTRSIWREVVDFLARLDGIDFRQTAPLRPGPPFVRPFGLEWVASEHALTRPVNGIKPTMIARAGALDQGNIVLNLQDVEARGIAPRACLLFLADSARSGSIKNAQGRPDPGLALRAFGQAVEIHRSGELRDVSSDEHLDALADVARRQNHRALSEALRQRYPGDDLVRRLARACPSPADDRLLRVGVLGCGPIAQAVHLDACRKARNAELYAVCDVADDLRERAAAVHRPRVAYRDYDAMLADPKVDAVLVAVADAFHVPACLQAIEAGKHVLVEKPLGMTVEECRTLRDRVAATGRVVQVGHNRRFDPGVAFARRFVREEMGRLQTLTAWYHDSTLRYAMTDTLQAPPPGRRAPMPLRPAKATRRPTARRLPAPAVRGIGHLLDTARFLCGPIAGLRIPPPRTVRGDLLVHRGRFRGRLVRPPGT